MATEIRYKYAEALKAAQGIIRYLTPHCDRIDLAGSIRREQHDVKDIEIVCQPKRELKKDPASLFDEGTVIISPDFIHALAAITDHVIKGKPEGRQMQIKTKSSFCPGIVLDLFLPIHDDYYRQLVIRTGSKDYVANVIASAWVRRGWVGAGEFGLRRKSDCELIVYGSSKKWRVINADGERPPVWKDEQDFFDWLGLPMPAPSIREVKSTLDVAQ